MSDLHVEFENEMQGKEIKETIKLRVSSFCCKMENPKVEQIKSHCIFTKFV